MVDHSSANAEVMSLNPDEVPKFFPGSPRICNCLKISITTATKLELTCWCGKVHELASLAGGGGGGGGGGISFRLHALSKCPGHRRGRGRRGGEQRTDDFPPKKQVANTISRLKQT